jgi:hypothetical protein
MWALVLSLVLGGITVQIAEWPMDASSHVGISRIVLFDKSPNRRLDISPALRSFVFTAERTSVANRYANNNAIHESADIAVVFEKSNIDHVAGLTSFLACGEDWRAEEWVVSLDDERRIEAALFRPHCDLYARHSGRHSPIVRCSIEDFEIFSWQVWPRREGNSIDENIGSLQKGQAAFRDSGLLSGGSRSHGCLHQRMTHLATLPLRGITRVLPELVREDARIPVPKVRRSVNKASAYVPYTRCHSASVLV